MNKHYRSYGPYACDTPEWILGHTTTRRDEIATIKEAMRTGRTIRIHGAWGSGKTWALSAAAADLALDPEQPTIQIMLKAEFWTGTEPEDVWRHVAHEMQLAEPHTHARQKCLEAAQEHNTRIAIFADDIGGTHSAAGEEDHIEELLARALAGTPHCAAMAYQEGATPAPGSHETLTLAPLAPPDSHRVWETWAQRSPQPQERTIIDTVLCGRPRALALFAQREAETPVLRAGSLRERGDDSDHPRPK